MQYLFSSKSCISSTVDHVEEMILAVAASLMCLFLFLSVVIELCDASPCLWLGICGTDTQEEMRYEGSPVKAPPLSRRRMTTPTPMQNSQTFFLRDHRRYEEEGRGWNARERTIIARIKTVSGKKFQCEDAS